MKVYGLNVGYGDCFIFHDPVTGTLLLDGGSGEREEYVGFPERIPLADFLRITKTGRIDQLIITHIHEDHVSGLLGILDQVEVGEVWTPYPIEQFEKSAVSIIDLPDVPTHIRLFYKALAGFHQLLTYFGRKQIPVRQLKRGGSFSMAGWQMRVLGPEVEVIEVFMARYRDLLELGLDRRAVTSPEGYACLYDLDAMSNATSLLLLLEYKDKKCLFCADNVPGNWRLSEREKILLKNVNVLKIPHHGQKDAVEKDMFEYLSPEYTVTTASADRRYDSAHQSVYRAFEVTFAGRPPCHLFTDPPQWALPVSVQAGDKKAKAAARYANHGKKREGGDEGHVGVNDGQMNDGQKTHSVLAFSLDDKITYVCLQREDLKEL